MIISPKKESKIYKIIISLLIKECLSTLNYKIKNENDKKKNQKKVLFIINNKQKSNITLMNHDNTYIINITYITYITQKTTFTISKTIFCNTRDILLVPLKPMIQQSFEFNDPDLKQNVTKFLKQIIGC